MVDDYVLTTTSRGPNDALLQHESRVNDYVYSHLHQQKDSEETNYKSKMVNDDNENKEYVDQKRHGRSQYQL